MNAMISKGFNGKISDIAERATARHRTSISRFLSSDSWNEKLLERDKRPVLILQNDKGNSSSKTTIIAPITTHQEAIKEKKIIRDGNEVIIYTVKQIVKGIEKEKTLGYYEVPVRLEHVQLNTISKYAMLRNCVFYVSK